MKVGSRGSRKKRKFVRRWGFGSQRWQKRSERELWMRKRSHFWRVCEKKYALKIPLFYSFLSCVDMVDAQTRWFLFNIIKCENRWKIMSGEGDGNGNRQIGLSSTFGFNHCWPHPLQNLHKEQELGSALFQVLLGDNVCIYQN